MENIFYINVQDDDETFNESPIRIKIRSTDQFTSSISTEQVDQFRQGIEITQPKHFNAGSVKIYSGELGHKLLKTNFGGNASQINDTFFTEPETISDVTNDDKLIEDGAIEPLTIRKVSNFTVNEKPVFHSVKGALQTANEDFTNSAEFVVNSFKRQEINEFIPFIDGVSLKTFQSTMITIESMSNLDPFIDKRYFENDDGLTSTNIDIFVDDLEELSLNERFCTCGWDDENNVQGTNSIVYIGLKY